MSVNGEDNALADVTNKVTNVNLHEEALHRVKEANWGDRQEYDYAKYTAGPREQTMPDQAQENSPVWAANAAKYEWNDEFGDVGPKHEELEEMLFGDEHLMKQGDEFSKKVAPSSPNACWLS